MSSIQHRNGKPIVYWREPTAVSAARRSRLARRASAPPSASRLSSTRGWPPGTPTSSALGAKSSASSSTNGGTRSSSPSKGKDNTIPNYEGALDRDILPYLGHLRLDQITVEVVQRWMVDVQSAVQQGRGRYPQRNRTGRATVSRAVGVLSGILRLAEDWDLIRRNPVPRVRNKPSQRPDHAPVVTAPVKVEAIRSELLVVRRRPLRDAVLVSTFAYTGCAPKSCARSSGARCSNGRC